MVKIRKLVLRIRIQPKSVLHSTGISFCTRESNDLCNTEIGRDKSNNGNDILVIPCTVSWVPENTAEERVSTKSSKLTMLCFSLNILSHNQGENIWERTGAT